MRVWRKRLVAWALCAAAVLGTCGSAEAEQVVRTEKDCIEDVRIGTEEEDVLPKETETPEFSEKAKPVIRSVRVSQVTSEGYTVTAEFSADGVSRVMMPTWTQKNGQDDLVWHTASVSGGKAVFQVKRSQHKYEYGTYITHVYVYDKKGRFALAGVNAVLPRPQTSADPPTIREITADQVTQDGYRVSIRFSAPAGVSRVEFPTWTDANGQDDLIWHRAQYTDTTASFYVKASEHRGERGRYTTHAYVYDRNGKFGIRGISVLVAKPETPETQPTSEEQTQPETEPSVQPTSVPSVSEPETQEPSEQPTTEAESEAPSEQPTTEAESEAPEQPTTEAESQAPERPSEQPTTEAESQAPEKPEEPAPSGPLRIVEAKVSEVSVTGYRITVKVNNENVSKVLLPTWTQKNGQDDIIWHEAKLQGKTATYTVQRRDHKGESGTYITHVYVYDAKGNNPAPVGLTAKLPDSSSVTKAPRITDAVVSDVNENGYTVTVRYDAPAGTARVAMPTWTQRNGQDDLVWHEVKAEENTAVFRIPVSKHRNESGTYTTHIYVYDFNGRFAVRGVTVKVPSVSNPDYIFIGDSRFYYMMCAVKTPANHYAITMGGAYYTWFETEAVPRLYRMLQNSPQATVIINMGVNDCGINADHAWKYIQKFNEIKARYPGAQLFFASVGPLNGYYGGVISPGIMNQRVLQFNQKMKSCQSASYLPLGEYLTIGGYSTIDGVHYDYQTSVRIHTYCYEMAKKMRFS